MLREDFGEQSDIDILVTFAPDATPSLFDMVTMEDELERIFGRSVDFVSRRGVENSRNAIRRQTILASAEVVYAAWMGQLSLTCDALGSGAYMCPCPRQRP